MTDEQTIKRLQEDGMQYIATVGQLQEALERVGVLEQRIADALQVLQQAGPWAELVGDAIEVLRGPPSD